MSSASDRNLLFGLLALHMDFVTRDALIDGMNAWLLRKADALGLVLQERGALAEADRRAVDVLVERHLARHGGSLSHSLAAVRVEAEVRDALARSGDAEVSRSASLLTAPAAPAVLPCVDALPVVRDGPRYRKLRAHARGGLGEVHVALDQELEREVALKEIQPRHADRPDYRARFLREAQITGALEHPGIVPVHGLGTQPDGRPYYAMRFIRGESLQEALARFHDADAGRRDPGERELALRSLLTRFVAVCYAVAYAHSRGVVHRDLKPANVMLGEYGETLVVDWGLAKVLDQPEAQTAFHRPVTLHVEGQTPTEMGQAVGTPAFMPPEQARGELERIDQRSDVFALGATLYCLLTGQPPYQRAGVSLLAAAAAGDHRPARAVNARVPAALAAVCARAMAFRPEDRYPTARALAGDLERWLADEPITAYRDPPGERFRRWSRRNRALVSAASVLLAASVVGLSLGLWAVGREKARTEAAARQATDNLAMAEANLARATAAEATATTRLRLAETNYKLARDAVDNTFGIAKNHPLLNHPALNKDLRQLRTLLLEKALPFYANFRAQRPGDPEAGRALFEQHSQVGYIQLELSRMEQSAASFRAAERVARQLMAAHPEEPHYRESLAIALTHLGDLARDVGRHEEALAHFREATPLLRRLVQDHPGQAGYRRRLALILNNLYSVLRGLGRYEEALDCIAEAVGHFRRSLRDQGYGLSGNNDLARALASLGHTQMVLAQGEPALRSLTEAAALGRGLVQAYPDAPQFKSVLSRTLTGLADARLRLGKREESLRDLHRAADLGREVARAHPDVPLYWEELAITLSNLGGTLRTQSRPKEAVAVLIEATQVSEKLVAAHPAVHKYKANLARAAGNLGSAFSQLNNPQAARRALEESVRLNRQLVAAYPGMPDYGLQLALSLRNLGLHLGDAGPLSEAVAVARRIVRDNPSGVAYQEAFAVALSALAIHFQEASRPEEALRCYHEAARLRRQLVHDHPNSPGYLKGLADTLQGLLKAQQALGNTKAALDSIAEMSAVRRRLAALDPHSFSPQAALVALLEQAFRQRDRGQRDAELSSLTAAVPLCRLLAGQQPNELSTWALLASTLDTLASRLQDRDQHEEALRCQQEAVEVCRRLLRASPGSLKQRKTLAGALTGLGKAHAARGDTPATVRCYAETVELGRRILAAGPGGTDDQKAQAQSLRLLATALEETGRVEEAVRVYTEAARLGRELLRAEPAGDAQQEVAAALTLFSRALHSANKPAAALHCCTEVIALYRQALARRPGDPSAQYWLGAQLFNRAGLLREQRQLSRAMADLDESLHYLAELARRRPDYPQLALTRAYAHQARAALLAQQGRHREAVADWDRAVALAPRGLQARYRVSRGYALAHAGEHDRAAAESAALARVPGAPPAVIYDLACILSLSAGGASRDARVPLPLRERQADERARQAIALLRRITPSKGPARATALGVVDRDRDLDFLRDREDFKRFRAGLP